MVLAARYGALIALIAAILNIYLVMRYFELNKAVVQSEGQFQQANVLRQAVEGILREFMQRANADAGIVQIFQRYQSQPQNPAPAGGAPAPAPAPAPEPAR